MLSEAMIAVTRAAALKYLSDTCVILRSPAASGDLDNSGSDGQGGALPDDADAVDGYIPQAPLPCRLQRRLVPAQTGNFSPEIAEIMDAVVVLPYDAAIKEEDRLTVTCMGESFTFEVAGFGKSTERFTLPVAVKEM